MVGPGRQWAIEPDQVVPISIPDYGLGFPSVEIYFHDIIGCLRFNLRCPCFLCRQDIEGSPVMLVFLYMVNRSFHHCKTLVSFPVYCMLDRKERKKPTFPFKNHYCGFKYHVSCTNGKISFRINLLFYLFFTVVPFNTCVFLSYRPFVVNTTFSTG